MITMVKCGGADMDSAQYLVRIDLKKKIPKKRYRKEKNTGSYTIWGY